jgi:hypothetical protein
MASASPNVVRRVFAGLDLVAALLLVIGVFVGLPARWWPIDTGAAIVAALLSASGIGLLRRAPWSTKVARIAAFVALGAGLLLTTMLLVTASYLGGIYGAVGKGGAVIMLLVVAMVLPYLVLFPAAQLLWLGPAVAPDPSPSPSPANGS